MSNKTLMAALMAMHAEFGVIIKKDSKGHKGTYASLPCILEQIQHMLNKHGMVLNQGTTIQYASAEDKYLFYTGLRTQVFHSESGEGIECESLLTPAPNSPSPDQAYGASMTYHRRYDAMALCGLVAEDDPSDHDGWNDHKPIVIGKTAIDQYVADPTNPRVNYNGGQYYASAKAPAATSSINMDTISEKQLGLLNMKLKGKDGQRDAIIKHYGSLEQVPWKDFNKLLLRIDGAE